MKEYLYFDKIIKSPDDLNRTLMFGEGAFETFRYKQQLPVFISRHLARLKKTSKLLGIKFPGDLYVETTIEKFVQEHKSDHFNNVIKDLIVKVVLFSAGGAAYSDPSDTTILCVSIKEDDSQRKQTNSLTIGKSRVSSTDIFNAHKTTNYLRSSIERRLAVASGFDTKNDRSKDSAKLLSWGLRTFDTIQVTKKNEPFIKLKVWLGKNENVNAVTYESVYLTIPKRKKNTIKAVIEYNNNLSAPIKKGDKIGVLNVFIKDELKKEIDVFSNENIKKANIFSRLLKSFNFLVWGDV